MPVIMRTLFVRGLLCIMPAALPAASVIVRTRPLVTPARVHVLILFFFVVHLIALVIVPFCVRDVLPVNYVLY